MEFLESLGVEVQPRVRGLTKSTRHEVDLYLPNDKVGVEYHGLYYHSSRFRDPKYHALKNNLLATQGIRLIQIWEDDWKNKRAIVEEHLRQVLGLSTLPKVSARRTAVVSVPKHKVQAFMSLYHIQGYSGAAYHYGLESEGELVAVASFKRRSNGELELVRYATNANVRGGHSKLVRHVERNHSYTRLITFADLAFSDGGLYKSTGWLEDGTLKPDYFYLYRGARHHKFNFRIKRFKEDPLLKYEEGMSERELAQLNNLDRVYDAGKIRFVKPHPNPIV